MATTIRDAVVRIGLQQIPTELKAPDISPITAAQAKIVEGEKQIQAEMKAGSVAHQAEADFRAELRAAATAAIEKHMAAFNAAREAETESQRVAAAEAEMAADKVFAANMKSFDSLKQLGEGAFTAARGIALLSASSEEDLAKMLKSLAKVQGAFDVFKGGTEVIQEGVKAYRQLPQMLEAATTAQVALNVAMKANPAGIAVAAVTTAIGLGVLAWSQWGDAAEDASVKAQKAAEAESKAIDRNVGLLRDQLSIASQIDRAKPGDATAERAKALSAIDTSGLTASMSRAQAREAAAAREAARIGALSPTGVSHITGSLRDIPGQQRALVEEQRRKELEAVKEQLEIAEALRGKSKAEIEVKITAERQREVQEAAKREETAGTATSSGGSGAKIGEAQRKSDEVIDAWLEASNRQLRAIERLRLRQDQLEQGLENGTLSR